MRELPPQPLKPQPAGAPLRGSEMSLHRPSLWLLAMAIALPAMAGPGNMSRPGGWESPAPQYGHGAGPGFGHRVDRLPGGVETLLLAGLTYYVLDGIFYRRQENHYVVVSPPPQVLVVAETGLIPWIWMAAAITSGRVTTTCEK